MKYLYIIAIFITLSSNLFAQGPLGRPKAPAVLPPPLASREVSGIVKDESGQTVIGALVTLKSAKDTIRTSTNEDGIFVMKGVKLATFNVTVSSIGSETFIKKYLNSDITKKIILDPITLKPKANELAEVKIDGSPSIVYKTDTVEYKASDYKVRPNSTVDELLKKMEGMEVGSDGSLVHNGEAVVKAKLNGKEFSGGNVAQAIKNLPADIVEKIQIVDDYGDMAARTGIKEGTPQKILNITTKPDRSVGTMGRVITQAGNNSRYNANLSVQRINANQVINVIGNINNSITGVGGGSPGTTESASPSVSYRDQWSKKVQVNTSYSYNTNNNNSNSYQYGTDPSSLGIRYFSQRGNNTNESHGHNLHFQLDVNLDSLNFLQINPSFGTSNSSNSNNNSRDQIDDYRDSLGNSLFQHLATSGVSSNSNLSKNYSVNALFVHLFRKPKRNISFNFDASHGEQTATGASNRRYIYYRDSTTTQPFSDSVANVINSRTNKNSSLTGAVTYTEPIGLLSLLEFRANFSQSTNNARAIQDSVAADGTLKEITARNNIYNFTVTQSRYTTSYRYNGVKVQFSIGATAIPYNLTGDKVDNSTSVIASSSRSTFKIIPAFRFAYQWSRTQRFQITYSGNNIQPDFQQIQPFTDISNPNNIIIGNPDLNPAFSHSINASYNNYIANSKLNFSFGLNANRLDDKITTNTIRRQLPPVSGNPPRSYNEVRFLNLDGTHSYSGNYNISKQLADRRYNLSLNGNVSYNYSTAMSNGDLYHTTAWRFDYRFGPRITPNDNIEFNPYIGYNLNRTFSNAGRSTANVYTTTRLAVDGRIYFLKTYQVNFNSSKNFVSGIQNSTNPLILNVGFQKEFLPRKNLVFTFNVYDVLHQNSFLRQDVADDGGVTNTVSSSLSRFFMVGLRLNLQKWSGRPKRNGKIMQRRGDGSFIYN